MMPDELAGVDDEVAAVEDVDLGDVAGDEVDRLQHRSADRHVGQARPLPPGCRQARRPVAPMASPARSSSVVLQQRLPWWTPR